mmetsp:Transcript_13058/g.35792  ORF Transcript_13058/g.35792 Transcript_13058/m.35792 type:complete len:267 (-) Transcript_13058:13-813(-)
MPGSVPSCGCRRSRHRRNVAHLVRRACCMHDPEAILVDAGAGALRGGTDVADAAASCAPPFRDTVVPAERGGRGHANSLLRLADVRDRVSLPSALGSRADALDTAGVDAPLSQLPLHGGPPAELPHHVPLPQAVHVAETGHRVGGHRRALRALALPWRGRQRRGSPRGFLPRGRLQHLLVRLRCRAGAAASELRPPFPPALPRPLALQPAQPVPALHGRGRPARVLTLFSVVSRARRSCGGNCKRPRHLARGLARVMLGVASTRPI